MCHARTVVFAAALLLAASPRTRGQTWAGPGTDWNTATNWSPQTVPNSASAVASFAGASQGTVNVSSSVQAQSLSFSNPTGNYTLTSTGTAALTVGTSITVAAGVGGIQTINLANITTGSLLLPAGSSPLTIANNSTVGGVLAIGPNTVIGQVGNNIEPQLLIGGPGNIFFTGSFATSGGHGIGGGLQKVGPGTLDLGGNGTGMSGEIELVGGTLVLNYSANAATKMGGAGQLFLSGGVLSVTPNSITAVTQSFSFGTFIANGGHTDVQATAAAGTVTLALGAITRDAPSTADFTPSTGSTTFTITTSSGTPGNLLGNGPAYATVGHGATWATVSGTSPNFTITGVNTYGTNVYIPGGNTDVTMSATVAGVTTNSLRFNTGNLTLTLSGTNTVQSGGILVTPSATGGTITGGTLTAPSSGELLVHQYSASPFTINSALVSTAGLTKIGPGTLVLSAANPGLTGGITVDRGSLMVTTTAAVNSVSGINFGDDRTGSNLQQFTVDLGNNVSGTISRNIAFAAFAPDGTGTVFSTGASTGSRITLDGALFSSSSGNSGTLTTPLAFTGDVSNTSGFNLSHPPSFINGPISLLHGFLGLNDNVPVSGAGNTLVLQVGDFANGGLEFLHGGITVARPVVMNNITRIASNGTNINTISGAISGPGGLFKEGTGTLMLNGDNSSFTGQLFVDAGTLVLGHPNALGSSTNGSTVEFGATLDLGGQAVPAVGPGIVIFGTGVGGNGALINSSATPASFAGPINTNVIGSGFISFTVGGSGDINLSGPIGYNVINTSLTKIGSGTLTLSGTADNFGLSVNVVAGTVVLAKTSSHSPDVHAIGGNPPLFGIIVSGGTAQLGGTGGDQIFDGGGVTVTSGTFDTNGRTETIDTLHLQGTGLANAGALVNTAAGASILTTQTTTQIGTTLTGDATIGVTQATGSLTVIGTFGGTFTLTKVGAGTAVLNGSATPSTRTAVNAGTLILSGANASWGGATVNGGTLQMGASNVFSPQAPVTMTGGTFNLNGFDQSIGSLTGVAGTVQLSFATLTVGGDNTSTTPAEVILGPGGLTKIGVGTLTLGNSGNTFTSLTINGGTVQTANDNTLGSGSVTVGPNGTLSYTGSSTTGRTFALNSGTMTVAAGQTLTLSGVTLGGGFLRGGGTYAVTGGSSLGGATTFASTTINQTGAGSYTNFTNGGTLNIAANVAGPIAMNGFSNEGSGAITIGAVSKVNVADFQSYGTLTVNPAVVGSMTFTELANTGTSPLNFNGGSRTFLGTPATANFNGSPTFVAGIDLNGKNAIVAGGLFVNNGFVVDSSNMGTGAATIVADFGALVKGAGFFQNPIITQNGGRVQAGNSPGIASFGRFVFGPGGVSNYVFAIDDATGTAGPSPDAAGHVSGWGFINAIRRAGGDNPPSSGNFTWTATPTDKLTVAIDTLVNPTTVGADVAGPMADFDPNSAYSWPAAHWAGTYSGPTDSATLNAATSFDASGFLNPVAGTFGWSLDPAGQTLSLVYTPSAVPEPGTLALIGAAAAVGWWRRRFSTVSV